ncbi:MAG: SMP-30/gluconolactonase/LRE family protein [Spirochaetes bacterium]|nr:SMP-30/gluconolactonase/LRE family protein [Spirochaetota bacterium]
MKIEGTMRSILGEGALWNKHSNRLLWIDIEDKKLFEYDPVTEIESVYQLPLQIGTVVPVNADSVILALKDGIYSFDMRTESLTKRADNPEKFRFNDGKCDPAGRLWVGTLDSEKFSRPLCSLYKIGPDFVIHKMIEKIAISNGIAWSQLGTEMYHIDTPRKVVTVYSFDQNSGTVSNGRIAIDLKAETGSPDGCTIDNRGNLWVAMWQGSAVLECCPQTGRVLNRYPVPAPNVTSVAFGGTDYETLYITTAQTGMSAGEKKQHPLAGTLFSFEPGNGIRGKAPFSFAL